jgi:hypothetical protein
LVRACLDGAREDFENFKCNSERGPHQIRRTNLTTNTLLRRLLTLLDMLECLATFSCGNLWLECETGRQPHEGRSKRICHLFHNRAREPQDEIHIFRCPAFESLHHEYPRYFESRAYGTFIGAYHNEDPMVDDLFRRFPTQGGPTFGLNLGTSLLILSFYMQA